MWLFTAAALWLFGQLALAGAVNAQKVVSNDPSSFGTISRRAQFEPPYYDPSFPDTEVQSLSLDFDGMDYSFDYEAYGESNAILKLRVPFAPPNAPESCTFASSSCGLPVTETVTLVATMSGATSEWVLNPVPSNVLSVPAGCDPAEWHLLVTCPFPPGFKVPDISLSHIAITSVAKVTSVQSSDTIVVFSTIRPAPVQGSVSANAAIFPQSGISRTRIVLSYPYLPVLQGSRLQTNIPGQTCKELHLNQAHESGPAVGAPDDYPYPHGSIFLDCSAEPISGGIVGSGFSPLDTVDFETKHFSPGATESQDFTYSNRKAKNDVNVAFDPTFVSPLLVRQSGADVTMMIVMSGGGIKDGASVFLDDVSFASGSIACRVFSPYTNAADVSLSGGRIPISFAPMTKAPMTLTCNFKVGSGNQFPDVFGVDVLFDPSKPRDESSVRRVWQKDSPAYLSNPILYRGTHKASSGPMKSYDTLIVDFADPSFADDDNFAVVLTSPTNVFTQSPAAVIPSCSAHTVQTNGRFTAADPPKYAYSNTGSGFRITLDSIKRDAFRPLTILNCVIDSDKYPLTYDGPGNIGSIAYEVSLGPSNARKFLPLAAAPPVSISWHSTRYRPLVYGKNAEIDTAISVFSSMPLSELFGPRGALSEMRTLSFSFVPLDEQSPLPASATLYVETDSSYDTSIVPECTYTEQSMVTCVINVMPSILTSIGAKHSLTLHLKKLVFTTEASFRQRPLLDFSTMFSNSAGAFQKLVVNKKGPATPSPETPEPADGTPLAHAAFRHPVSASLLPQASSLNEFEVVFARPRFLSGDGIKITVTFPAPLKATTAGFCDAFYVIGTTDWTSWSKNAPILFSNSGASLSVSLPSPVDVSGTHRTVRLSCRRIGYPTFSYESDDNAILVEGFYGLAKAFQTFSTVEPIQNRRLRLISTYAGRGELLPSPNYAVRIALPGKEDDMYFGDFASGFILKLGIATNAKWKIKTAVPDSEDNLFRAKEDLDLDYWSESGILVETTVTATYGVGSDVDTARAGKASVKVWMRTPSIFPCTAPLPFHVTHSVEKTEEKLTSRNHGVVRHLTCADASEVSGLICIGRTWYTGFDLPASLESSIDLEKCPESNSCDLRSGYPSYLNVISAVDSNAFTWIVPGIAQPGSSATNLECSDNASSATGSSVTVTCSPDGILYGGCSKICNTDGVNFGDETTVFPVDPSTAMWTVGMNLVQECREGTSPVSLSTVACKESGFTGAPLQCAACLPPSSGDYITIDSSNSGFSIGEVVTSSCMVNGITVTDTSTRMHECTASGWSPALKCEPQGCIILKTEDKNFDLTIPSEEWREEYAKVGAVATVECKFGLISSSPAPFRTCLEDGTWDWSTTESPDTFCTPISGSCSVDFNFLKDRHLILSDLKRMTETRTSYVFEDGGSAFAGCDSESVSSSGQLFELVRCRSGTLALPAFTCLSSTCDLVELPSTPHGVCYVSEVEKLNNFYTFKTPHGFVCSCNDGYVPGVEAGAEAVMERTCLESGWSPEVSTCVEALCPVIDFVGAHGDVTLSLTGEPYDPTKRDMHLPDVDLTVECHANFTLSGPSGDIFCDNGVWEHDLKDPACIPSTCPAQQNDKPAAMTLSYFMEDLETPATPSPDYPPDQPRYPAGTVLVLGCTDDHIASDAMSSISPYVCDGVSLSFSYSTPPIDVCRKRKECTVGMIGGSKTIEPPSGTIVMEESTMKYSCNDAYEPARGKAVLKCMSTGQFEQQPECVLASGCRPPFDTSSSSFEVEWLDGNGNPTTPDAEGRLAVDTTLHVQCNAGLSGIGSYPDLFEGVCTKTDKGNYVWTFENNFELISDLPYQCEITDCSTIDLGERGSVSYDEVGKFEGGNATVSCLEYFSGEESIHQCLSGNWNPPVFCRQTYCSKLEDERFNCKFEGSDGSGFYPHGSIATCSCGTDWFHIDSRQSQNVSCETPDAPAESEWDLTKVEEPERLCAPKADCMMMTNVTDIRYERNNLPYTHPDPDTPLPLGTVARRRCVSYPWEPVDPERPEMTTTCREYGWDNFGFTEYPLCQHRPECDLSEVKHGVFDPPEVYVGGSTTLICNSGFEERDGIRDVECLENSLLSRTVTCVTRTHCSSFEGDIVATYDSDSTTHLHPVGTTATISCPTGKSATVDTQPDMFVAVCSDQHEWVSADSRIDDPLAFECKKTLCPSFDVPYGSVTSYSGNPREVGSIANVECFPGFTRRGENPVCARNPASNTGKWSLSSSSILMVVCDINDDSECTSFDASDGNFKFSYIYEGRIVVPSNKGNFPIGTTVRRSCNFPKEPADENTKFHTAKCSGPSPATAKWANFPSEELCKDIPKCAINSVSNGELVPNDSVYRGETIKLTCKEGFQPSKGLAIATCFSSGSTSPALSCEPQTHCLPLENSEVGNYVFEYYSTLDKPPLSKEDSLLLAEGYFARTSCTKDFSSAGSLPNALTFTCVKKGKNSFEWESDDGVNLEDYSCSSSYCGSLDLDNAIVTYDDNGRDTGAVATIQCMPTYEPVNGVTTSTCEASGWTSAKCGLAMCERYNDISLSCNYFETSGEMIKAGTSTFAADVIARCTCSPDHYGDFDTNPAEFVCVNKNTLPYTWDKSNGPDSTCRERILCRNFDVSEEHPRSVVYSQAHTGGVFPLQTTVSVRCMYPSEGIASPNAVFTATCRNSGWEPKASLDITDHCQEMPQCTIPTIDFGTIESIDNKSTIYLGDVVRTTCEQFYVVRTSPLSSCQRNSVWEPQPECVPQQCDRINHQSLSCTYWKDSSQVSNRQPGTIARCSCGSNFAGPYENSPVELKCVKDLETGFVEWTQDGNAFVPEDPFLAYDFSGMDSLSFSTLSAKSDNVTKGIAEQCVPVVPCKVLKPHATDMITYTLNGVILAPHDNDVLSRDTIAQYGCSWPYTPRDESVNAARTCTVDGWTDISEDMFPFCQELPTCELPTIANGKLVFDNSSGGTGVPFYAQSRYIVECDDEFAPTDGNQFLHCTRWGLSGTVGCSSTRCKAPNWVMYACSFSDGDLPYPFDATTFKVDSTAMCRCADGFQSQVSNDPSSRNPIRFECVSGYSGFSSWEPKHPNRTLETRPCLSSHDCGTPPQIKNAETLYSSTIAGSYATYMCNDHYYIEGSDSTSDQVGCSAFGWVRTPKCTVCTNDIICPRPYPVVLDASFSPNYGAILLTFNVPSHSAELTIPPGATSNCIRILTPQSVTTLGSGAVCSWMARDTLRIVLGRAYSIRPRAKLNIEAKRIRNGDLEDRADFYNRAQSVTVKAPHEEAGTLAVIDAPTTISDRVGFTMSGGRSRGAGGLALSFAWSLVSSSAPPVVHTGVEKRFSELVDRMTVKSQTFTVSGSPLYAPALVVPNLAQTADTPIFAPGYTYTVGLTVTSWYGSKSTVRHSFTIPPITGSSPAVVAMGGRTLHVSRSRSIYVPTTLYFSSPRDFSNALSLSWRLHSSSTDEKDLTFFGSNFGLLIPPFTLSAGAEYVFRATVTHGLPGSTYETIKIVVEDEGVIARSPSFGITHNILEDLILSAEGSRNLGVDHNNDATAGLEMEWTCFIVKSHEDCFDPVYPLAGEIEVTVPSTDLEIAFNRAGRPPEGAQLELTLSVSVGRGNTQTVSGIITIVDNNNFDDYKVHVTGSPLSHTPAHKPVRLAATYEKMRPRLPDGVIFWSCDTRNVPMNDLSLRLTPSLNGPVLSFKAGTLAPGNSYTFRAHLFASEADFPTVLPAIGYQPLPKELASASFTVTPNLPPFGGSCGPAPSPDGSAPHKVGSDLVLVCQGWEDDDIDVGPLIYTWYSDMSPLDENGKPSISPQLVEIGPASPDATLNVRFPAASKLSIVVHIADTWGSFVQNRFTVEVAPDASAPPSTALAMLLTGTEIARNQKRPGLVDQTVISILNAIDSGKLSSSTALRQRMLELLTDHSVQELKAASQTARVVSAEGGYAGDGILSIGEYKQPSESEAKVSLISAICNDPETLSADERLLAARLQIAASADLVYRGPIMGISDVTRKAILSSVGNIIAAFKFEAGLVDRNVAVRTSSIDVAFKKFNGIIHDDDYLLPSEPLEVPTVDWALLSAQGRAHAYARDQYAALGIETRPQDVDASGVLVGEPRARLLERIRARAAGKDIDAKPRWNWFGVTADGSRGVVRRPKTSGSAMDDNAVLIMALQAEAGSAANIVQTQLAIAAAATLQHSVRGEKPVSERANGVEVVSMAGSLNDVPASAGLPVTSDPVAALTMPSFSIPRDLTSAVVDGTTFPAGVNMVRTIIDNNDLISFAGLRAGEYLNGSSSTPLVSLSFYGRDQKPVDTMIAPNVMVPVVPSIKLDTRSLGENITITLPHPKQEFEIDPVCEFWAPNPGASGQWSTTGCSVLKSSPTQTVCTCSHLTLFRSKLSYRDFLPSFNTLSGRDFMNLTPENVRKHPVPLIMILVWLFLTVVAAIIASYIDRVKDRRALLYLREQWAQGVRGLEALRLDNPYDDSANPMKKRIWSRVEFSLRHDHLWASIFLRDDTNSYSSTGRCITAFVLFLSSYFTNVLFFGSSQASMAFISISLISAAILMPIGLILTAVFFYTQTGRVKSMIYEYAEHVCKLRHTGMSEYPAYRDKPEHQLQWFFFCSPSVERIQLNEIAILAGWSVSAMNQRIIPTAPRNEAKFKLKLRTMVDIKPDRLIAWYNTRPLLDRLPKGLRMLAFVFLFIWVLFCMMMILVYGMQLDLYRENGTIEWLRSSALSNALDILLFRLIIISLKTIAIMIIFTLILNRRATRDQHIADRELTTIRHLDDEILRAQLAEAGDGDDECAGDTAASNEKKVAELTPAELEALRQKRLAEEERLRRRQEFLRNKDLVLADLATEDDDGVNNRDDGVEMGRLDFGNVNTATPPRKPRVLGTIGLDVAAPSREAAAESVMLADEVGESYRAAPTLMAIDPRARTDAPYGDSVALGGKSFAASLAAERAAAQAEEKKRRDAEAAQRAAAARASIASATPAAASAAGVPGSSAYGAGLPTTTSGSGSFTPAYKRMSFAATPRGAPGTPGGLALAVTPRPPMSSHARASAVYNSPATPQMPPQPLVTGPLPSQQPPPARHRSFVAGTSALESHLRQMAEDKDAATAPAPVPSQGPLPLSGAPFVAPSSVAVPGSSSGSADTSETSTERKSPSEAKKGPKKLKKAKKINK